MAGIVHAFSERVDRVIETDATDETDVTELRRRAEALAERQQRAIDHLRTLLAAVADRRRALIDARERHEELASEAAMLAEQRVQAAELLAEAGRDLVRAARVYIDAASALRSPTQRRCSPRWSCGSRPSTV